MAVCADCGTVFATDDVLTGPDGKALCLDCLIELLQQWFKGRPRLRWQFLQDFAHVSV